MATPLELDASARPHGPPGRLDDFRWAGRLWPLLASLAVAAALYAWRGTGAAFWLFVELWTAYAVAWLSLALLRQLAGSDVPLIAAIAVAVVGCALGGATAAAIALAPDWRALLDTPNAAVQWGFGAAFATFFVGTSLVTAEVRRREHAASDIKRQLLEARLQTLTAQIEPHFLMNTLANLRYLIGADTASASRLLEHLADFLQGALERSRATHSTLGAELALVSSYLTIMQVRLGDRLTFAIDAPAEVADVPFPPLLLQTLVENALKHGIEPCAAGGRVDIRAERIGDRVLVRVQDDGVGLDAASTPGVGLRNSRERLATFYGGRASLELARAPRAGTVAAISIPAFA